MRWLSLLVYVGDAWVLVTYALLANTNSPLNPYVTLRRTRWFHWANAVAGAPTITFEVLAHAWPVMPLTVTFCLVGWIGVWRTRNAARY